MLKKGVFIVLALLFFLPQLSLAQNIQPRFIEDSIWYSKDPFEEGDKIKIYTAIFNPDAKDLSGTLSFFDKNVLLGKKNFTVPARGVRDVSIDWTVTAGSHSIFAKLANTETDESKRTVSKKAAAKPAAETKEVGGEAETSFASMEKIENLIADSTPDLISKPIVATATAIEGFRSGVGESSKTNKEEIKKDLADQKNVKPEDTKNIQEKGRLDTPFKYLSIFFWSLVSFVFNNKLVFYGLSVIIIFFLFRYVWRLVF